MRGEPGGEAPLLTGLTASRGDVREPPLCIGLGTQLALIDRLGERVKVGAESIEQPKDRAQSDVALPGLQSREVGAARAHARGDLLLREPCALA